MAGGQDRNLYLKNFTENSIMKDPAIVVLEKKLNKWISFTVSNGFYDNCEYKGCYLEQKVVDDLMTMHIEEDDIYETMKKITGPLLRHSRAFDIPKIDIDDNGASQDSQLLPQHTDMTVESHISQNWTQEDTNLDQEGDEEGDDDDNSLKENENIDSESNLTERGSDLWNRTMDVLDCVQTKQDAQEFHRLLIQFKSKINGRNCRGNDCSVFGAEVSKFGRKKRRHKYCFES
jgi:hypothetical protein